MAGQVRTGLAGTQKAPTQILIKILHICLDTQEIAKTNI
jgi:hypothetical protein